jgi:hypothetical protein
MAGDRVGSIPASSASGSEVRELISAYDLGELARRLARAEGRHGR